MPAVMRFFRILRLAARFFIGEFRRDPKSLVDIFRRVLASIFGRLTLGRNEKSAVVQSVLQAEAAVEATPEEANADPGDARTEPEPPASQELDEIGDPDHAAAPGEPRPLIIRILGRLRRIIGRGLRKLRRLARILRRKVVSFLRKVRRARSRFRNSFYPQFGLGLVRQGHITDATWLMETIAERHPEHTRVAAAAVVVAGERRVLSGDWTPPGGPPSMIESHPGRVLHIVGKSLPHVVAGYTIRTQSIVAAQRAVGLDPEVVSRIGFPYYVDAVPSGPVEQVDGINYHRIGGPEVPPRWDDRLDANVEALLPVVERVKPAVIHAHSDFENPLLALALRDRYGIPVVNEVRGFWEETWLSGSPERRPTADRYRLRHQREVACAKAADRVVTLAATMERRLVRDGVEPSKISIIPNAVDPQRFPRVGRDPRLVRELEIRPEDVVIGYISSLVDYEGVDTLLEATAKLVDAGHPVRCLVVGDGKARERLETVAGKLHLGRHVTFTGRVSPDGVLAYYGLIDVFVVPRRNDRVCRLVTPLKPFEAMSTGTALVMSGVEALQDIAEESQAAATFHPEDPDDLVATLRPLLADPAARERLGDQGHEWVRGERTWAKNADRYRELYEDLGVL